MNSPDWDDEWRLVTRRVRRLGVSSLMPSSSSCDPYMSDVSYPQVQTYREVP